ncbi:hypothetical protein PS467_31975 [Streptomyces luomodiensis]|uniref:Uncharacterized protein n=1 Tax=Streptomyces luomodiensis TaxID=3026192 RepID=A0ABY9V4B7_9ACTN|nr:hypothetical protein [Streptomyces sp. SCA4-21]WNE99623.1 hypothetical protein PS467_31975 [Streptomyces sp. SCA4-21]
MPSTFLRSSTFLGPGTGRRRKPRKETGSPRPSATGLVLAATASVLCAGPAAPAMATAHPATGSAPGDDCEPDATPSVVTGGHNGLVVIDNSFADSWLEVDRTLNTLLLSRGTAGSDHDGGGGAIDVVAGDTAGADWVAQLGHPPWQGESGD